MPQRFGQGSGDIVYQPKIMHQTPQLLNVNPDPPKKATQSPKSLQRGVQGLMRKGVPFVSHDNGIMYQVKTVKLKKTSDKEKTKHEQLIAILNSNSKFMNAL